MDPSTRLKIRTTMARIVDCLVRQDYAGLETLSNGLRLNAQHIESGIVEYGKTLIQPPESAFDSIDAIPIKGTLPPQYSIRFRVFTKEEGQSDLEVQATFIDEISSSDFMRVELDGILVP